MKISDFGPGPKFACNFPDCKVTGPADKMWNVKGTNVILCTQHSHEARKHGKFVYRLSVTLTFLQEKEEKAKHFFASVAELSRKPGGRGSDRR